MRLYANAPHLVQKVVFSLSSSETITWLYPKNPSRSENFLDPGTVYRSCSLGGTRSLSFVESLFKFLKSTQRQISLDLFLTGTKLSKRR